MMHNTLNKGKYVIMGLAKSGLAVAERLLELGAEIAVTDIKKETQLESEVNLLERKAEKSSGRIKFFLGYHPEAILENAQALIVSPGIPLEMAFIKHAKKKNIPIWSEIEFAYRLLEGKIIGITGSNGKSTTTALTAHILKSATFPAVAAGNIGEPLSNFITHDSAEKIYITELSSFQLELIPTFRPCIAAVLNITPDHLDRYSSMKEYAYAKWNIFKNMSSEDFAILNTSIDMPNPNCKIWLFSTSTPLDKMKVPCSGLKRNEIVIKTMTCEIPIMDISEIPLPGRHNIENILVAATISHLLGVQRQSIREGILKFKALPHRLEWIASVRQRDFYNDSKATNVDSSKLAIEAFERKIVLILGGKDKGASYSPLVNAIASRVRHCVLIGAAAQRIEKELKGIVPTIHCRDLDEAVRKAFSLSKEGDIVLLSPACASFDMFMNFEHRGDVFRDSVLRLKKEIENE